jgi:ergothioneine biosynthesis protein EgtB
MATRSDFFAQPDADTLSARYLHTRTLSVALTDTLEIEDTVVQTMPDVSPTKWHLAHTTWFFEHFVLAEHLANYAAYDESFDFLFNSYYYTAGTMHRRPERGLLTRPSFAEVLAYRTHVDEHMLKLIETDGERIESLVTLGHHHEQQHQELLLTDNKHDYSMNPLQHAVMPNLPDPPPAPAPALDYTSCNAGSVRIGAGGEDFCFDNETPRHDALLADHRIANRLVTNDEFRAFIEDGAYREPSLWLSDGWAAVRERGWNRPLYWNESRETEFTLGGTRAIDEHAPVAHVSYYEADAFARWAGARLPTEFEWEHVAANETVAGNFLDAGFLHPVAGNGRQLFGDVWEWTSSAYAPYPGFRPLPGSLGEYNGKFMCQQFTVRGGSCVSSETHLRATYRSFFYPDARWQFLGIRLAKDGTA